MPYLAFFFFFYFNFHCVVLILFQPAVMRRRNAALLVFKVCFKNRFQYLYQSQSGDGDLEKVICTTVQGF